MFADDDEAPHAPTLREVMIEAFLSLCEGPAAAKFAPPELAAYARHATTHLFEHLPAEEEPE